jgi:hypothetical protein
VRFARLQDVSSCTLKRERHLSEAAEKAETAESDPVFRDNEPPAITVNGESPVTIGWGSTYTDAGAAAYDACSDTDLTASLATADPVDTSTPGEYTVRYTVSDASGNTAEETRAVTVEAAAPSR